MIAVLHEFHIIRCLLFELDKKVTFFLAYIGKSGWLLAARGTP